MPYYPDQRYISEMTTIRREVALPDDAIGRVRVQPGDKVDIRDEVARGMIPARHRIVEAQRTLRLRNPDAIKEKLLVKLGERVKADQPIAGDPKRRGRRVVSPVNGILAYAGEGRIIIQETPRIIKLEAGVRGRVVEVNPRSVVMETVGALVQGVWGNGRSTIAALRMAPAQGIESIRSTDMGEGYRNEIVITPHPLTASGLKVAETRAFAGLIAPSMPAPLLQAARENKVAVLLTEGFGRFEMTPDLLDMLMEFEGLQAALDAYLPRRYEPRRPEIVINRVRGDNLTPLPDPLIPLRRDTLVRVSRAPYLGQVGRIVDLPDAPILLETGLRLPCARVDLSLGGVATLPLANLELVGR